MYEKQVRKIPWRRKSCPVFLPGKSNGQRNLVGYSLWGHKRVGRDLVSKQQQQAEKEGQREREREREGRC